MIMRIDESPEQSYKLIHLQEFMKQICLLTDLWLCTTELIHLDKLDVGDMRWNVCSYNWLDGVKCFDRNCGN